MIIFPQIHYFLKLQITIYQQYYRIMIILQFGTVDKNIHRKLHSIIVATKRNLKKQ